MAFYSVTFSHVQSDERVIEKCWTVLAHSWEEAQHKIRLYGEGLSSISFVKYTVEPLKIR